MIPRSLSPIFILILFSCGDEDVAFKENVLLKSHLEGRWGWGGFQWFGGQSVELEFQGDKVSWYDSTVNVDDQGNGEIQTIRGNCAVKYSFNDGVEYYKPTNGLSISFGATTEDNIIWVFINNEQSTLRNYTITNNVVKFDNEFTAPGAASVGITSSFVILSTDLQVADFYAPVAFNKTFYHWGTYNKIN